MKRNLASGSLFLFGLSILLLGTLTAFEPALRGMSLPAERLVTFLLLVLPAGVGLVLGLLSLFRKEGRTWLAIAGILLNGLFGLFHSLILLFAG